MADLDPELVKQRLAGLKGVQVNRVIDDRYADGTTLSVILTILDPSNDTINKLHHTLVALPNVVANIMDHIGKESAVDSLNADQIRKFEIKE